MTARANPYALFDAKVPVFGPRLMHDLGVKDIHAAAVFGNAGQESGGFLHMQELHPVSGRGGWSWFQWTGPRRLDFERWALDHGHGIADDEAAYGFLVHELRTTEAGALRGLKRTTTLHAATETFALLYERPGVLALDNRVKWAGRALPLIQAGSIRSGAPAGPAAPKPATPLPAPVVTPPAVPAVADSAWEHARKRLVAHYGALHPEKET